MSIATTAVYKRVFGNDLLRYHALSQVPVSLDPQLETSRNCRTLSAGGPSVLDAEVRDAIVHLH